MATFAKPTFSAVAYAAYRPAYPRALYDVVSAYHEQGGRAAWDVALDLGCGTGQATTALTGFEHVIGIDPSPSMIAKANASIAQPAPSTPRFTFLTHTAEHLDFLDDASVDLVISAQAAHWFDYPRLWPQLARILRPHGTVAFWGYSQFRLASHPRLTPLIHTYCHGTHPTHSLGPYWEQPGRSILDHHLLAIPDAPSPLFTAHQRLYYTGTHHPHLPHPLPVLLHQRMPWPALQAYLRTFSSLHTYHEHHPADKARRTGLPHRPPRDDDAGDVVERFWWRLKEEVARQREEEGQGEGEGEEVDVEWPLAMILCKRA